MPRPKTPTYYLFYLLFSVDSWRLAIGFLASVLLAPLLFAPDQSMVSRAMLYVMVAAIGWAASGKPARWITNGLKKVLLE
jgi:high-affinity nickel permease